MPPKRATPSEDISLMLPPLSPSPKRTRFTPTTPSIPVPTSLFFTIPIPALSASPDDPPPSDSQFTDFIHAQATALPPETQSLYISALANLAPDNTPDLTSEMRASLTAAVTAFTMHLPPMGGQGEKQLDFLRRLGAGEVTCRELVNWADTTTAALRAFTATGGGYSPAPSTSFTTPTPSPTISAHPASVSPNPGETRDTPPAQSQTRSFSRRNSGRSAVVRERTLTRDANACVITGIREALTLEVAHIIPFSVRGEKAATFWGFLGIFLGVERAQELRGATLQLAENSGNPAGEVANCLLLNVMVHRFLDGGVVEIVPVMGSGGWGVGGEYDPSVVCSYDIIIRYPGCAFLPLHRIVYPTTPELPSATLLTSGTRITLTTPDPTTMPLPHPLLLQLHALIGRLKRLRAAAGWPVLPLGPALGGEELEWWGEEEEEVDEWEEHEEVGGRNTMQRIQGWVLGCFPSENLDPDYDQVSGRGEEDQQEGEREGGEDWERPRKVPVVIKEMGMREKERWRLIGGRNFDKHLSDDLANARVQDGK